MVKYGRIWHMTVEQTSGQNYERYRSAEKVNQLKDTIRTQGLIGESAHNDENKNKAGEIVMQTLGISKGESVSDLIALYNNGNIGSLSKDYVMAGAKDLAQAYYEVAMDFPQLSKKVIAGPFSIDEQLPKSMKGLGELIASNFTTNEDLRRNLDTIDYLKNDPEFGGDKILLSDQTKDAIESIKSIRVSPVLQKDLFNQKNLALQYLLSESEKYKKPTENRYNKNRSGDDVYEGVLPEDESGEVMGSRWEVSPENAAMAMKFMDYSLRWQTYTPPKWFKDIKPIYESDGKTVKESKDDIQARIEYMVMVNDGASFMSKAGKDLDKIQGNPMWFAFDNEKFTKLFNEDFKLVTSKMLHDLCEIYTDKNGRECLRYKEGINKKGKEGILASVEDKLENIRDYKEEMATFLAKQNGREKANYLDQMNAYTAWNLFYMFGDSSIADRTRVLPTYGGIISDGMRTLNPEYKAKGKWKVFKEEKELFEAEYFGGSLADYALSVMRLEKDLGEPINGKKTLREKIADGEMKIFDHKMCYGFFDFTHGTRDLCKPNGEKFTADENVTLATLLMDYASFDNSGNLINKNENGEFSFGHNQVDFMNWFRDQIETAALSYNCMMGKADVKSPESWAHNVKDKIGMVRGISINKQKGGTYNYTTSPDYWADMILGSFGADTSRLSSDYIYVKAPKEVDAGGYNLFLYKLLVQDLNLSNEYVNLNEVMRYMGVKVKEGGDPRGFKLTVATDLQRKNDRDNTEKLYRKLNKKTAFK